MKFNSRSLLADIAAGLTVSFAAISLGAAFGVMSGRGAFAGMVGAAVIPIITSLFGGTRLQASGPTAPMTAVAALTVAFAYDNFPQKELAEQFITLVFILNGLILIIAAFTRVSAFIRLVPNVVILGFMNGIAVLIWYDQLIKIFAFNNNAVMQGGIFGNLVLAFVTFFLIFGIIWFTKRVALRPQLKSLISGVLFSIIIMTALTRAFNLNLEHVALGNSLDSFAEFKDLVMGYIPTEILKMEYILMALPFALQLTLLAYLDSLLTALVIDRMTKEKSNLDKELFAQGLGNSIAGFLQGIPGAQATIRSVLLIKEGAKTRLAGVLIGVFALLSILVFIDYLAIVPAAVFIGVLFKAGLDVADKDFLKNYIARKWFHSTKRNIQFGFIAFTTIVTVLIDLNVAVVSGAILFYIAKYFWGIEDVEPDLQEVSEQKIKKSYPLNVKPMNIYKSLLEGNKKWVQEKLQEDQDFFNKLAKGQNPEILWIGCSDSRVPANEITRTKPGEIFVHRNIANMVVHTDMNMLSVLDYAVNVLKVKHVIVCGHYGCGGVKAAMGRDQFGIIDNWLRNIKDVYRLHAEELDSIQDEQERFDRLVELNIIEQVFDLIKTSIIQNAWQHRNEPVVHGWVYSLNTGLIKDLNVSYSSSDSMPSIFRMENGTLIS